MRKAVALSLCLAMMVWSNCSRHHRVVDPGAQVDPGKTYVLTYWDVELPAVLDPQGRYKATVEGLVQQFCARHANISVDIRWLPWGEADRELARALRDGIPPDLFADWQGLARYDHALQIPAGLYLEGQLLPAARRAVTHQGQIWAWPRWLWPQGLVAMRSAIALSDPELELLLFTPWDWQGLGRWLAENGFRLHVNDWQGQFLGQAVLAAAGHGFAGQWSGQELVHVLTALADLLDRGLLERGGEYQKIAGGHTILGGTTPAFLSWLRYNLEEPVLLPVPGFYRERLHYPVMTTALLHFRQLQYKGDDHSRAAAMLAAYLAAGQAEALSAYFWALPAWADSTWDSSDLPPWYYSFLADVGQLGAPLSSIDRLGRKDEARFREGLAAILDQFWSGKLDVQQAALAIEALK